MDFAICETAPQNVFKFCPRCGAPGFKEKSHYCFYCESCRFHYYVNSATAAAALVVNDRRELLLVRRGMNPGKGLLDLPGGFVDVGERPEDAVIREFKEEMNITLSDPVYFASFPNTYEYKGLTYFITDLFFRASVLSFDSVKLSDELKSYEYVPPEEIDLSQIAFSSIRNAVKKHLDSLE